MKAAGRSVIFIARKLGRGALGRRRDRRHPPRHRGRHGRPRRDHAPPARRADGRQRTARPETAESTVTDRPALTVDTLRLAAPGGKALLDDISFTIHAGEVLGIAGVRKTPDRAGRRAHRPAPRGLRHHPLPRPGHHLAVPTRKRREQGVGYIPEDRHRHGLFLEAPLWENRILGHVTEKPNSKGVWLDLKGAQQDTRRIVETYDVRTPGMTSPRPRCPAATSRS
ncbi:ABC transporter ATP-binding protein OS=Streptomyces tendae OX=1932 GN=GUR47_16340 PE=4 SV=1 [Streptomyces tendae]